MKKVFIAIVVLGFAWAWEPTRVRMVLWSQPVLERLGPVGDWAIGPVLRYNTRVEIDFITDQIRLAKTEGRAVPDTRSFQRWMQERVRTKNNGKDPWNNPYYLRQVNKTLTVGSVGEDGERGTDDDIEKSIPL